MKRALILDSVGREIMTVNEDYDTINILIPERPSKNGNKPAMEYQIKGKELLKELHRFIGGVIKNNTAVNKLRDEIKILQDQSLKAISGSKESKEISDKIEKIRNKYLEIIKR